MARRLLRRLIMRFSNGWVLLGCAVLLGCGKGGGAAPAPQPAMAAGAGGSSGDALAGAGGTSAGSGGAGNPAPTIDCAAVCAHLHAVCGLPLPLCTGTICPDLHQDQRECLLHATDCQNMQSCGPDGGRAGTSGGEAGGGGSGIPPAACTPHMGSFAADGMSTDCPSRCYIIAPPGVPHGKAWCTIGCTADTDCPHDFACDRVQAGCVPVCVAPTDCESDGFLPICSAGACGR
jgi:hypothetical protein